MRPSSKVDDRFLKHFCLKYGIGPEYKPTAPQPNDRITDCPKGYIGLYTKHFESANLRLPFSLFFLEFLKHHKLNISQLTLAGAMKITHFEIMCRVLGGEPSLALFRQFFVVLPFPYWGNLYTVSQRRSRCISWVPKSVPPWEDSFFWVSADASMPFKMGWRQGHESLNVLSYKTDKFDDKLYQLLVNHPTPLQPFPEHVLVMIGMSRKWPHLKAEPVIKDGNEEMDLLKYIKKKGVGNAGVMRLALRPLAEHEVHILERTKGICYEGCSSKDVEIPHEGQLQSEVQGTSGGRDVDTHPEKGEQQMVIDLQTVSEPASSSEKRKNDFGNAGVTLTSRSLAEHEVHILDRTKGICYEGTTSKDVEIPHEVLQSKVQGSSGGDVEQKMVKMVTDPETVSEPASPSKKRKNVVVIAIDDSPVQSSDENTPHTGNTPVVEVEAPVSASNKRSRGKRIVFTDESSSDHYEVGQTSTGKEYVPKSVPEVVTGWYERKAKMEARLRDRISRYRLRMTFQHQKIRKLEKKVRKLKKSSKYDNGREAMRMLAKNTHKHAKVVESLKKELEQVNGELDQERSKAAHEKDGWTQERVSLEKSLERVVSERRWLIEEGFQYVIKKLHGSRQFLEPLGAMESNLWSSGAHDGLVEGYANCKAGVALEHNRLYQPKAEGKLIRAADELFNMQYPYVVALSQCRDRTLDELKALEPDSGMEDEGAGCSKKAGKAV